MTDVPLLELARFGFQVKLEGQSVTPIGECLVLILRVRRQPLRALGQVEAIAMPMKDNRIRIPKRVQAG